MRRLMMLLDRIRRRGMTEKADRRSEQREQRQKEAEAFRHASEPN